MQLAFHCIYTQHAQLLQSQHLMLGGIFLSCKELSGKGVTPIFECTIELVLLGGRGLCHLNHGSRHFWICCSEQEQNPSVRMHN